LLASARRLLCTVAIAAALNACTLQRQPTREIVLVARGMTFSVEEHADVSNPVIRLRAGERVRLVLENQAPGLLHDFAIPAWGVEIAQMRAGERGDVTFDVPDTPGRVEYLCRPHAGMMTGYVEVVR
jgi:plastocyanin